MTPRRHRTDTPPGLRWIVATEHGRPVVIVSATIPPEDEQSAIREAMRAWRRQRGGLYIVPGLALLAGIAAMIRHAPRAAMIGASTLAAAGATAVLATQLPDPATPGAGPAASMAPSTRPRRATPTPVATATLSPTPTAPAPSGPAPTVPASDTTPPPPAPTPTSMPSRARHGHPHSHTPPGHTHSPAGPPTATHRQPGNSHDRRTDHPAPHPHQHCLDIALVIHIRLCPP